MKLNTLDHSKEALKQVAVYQVFLIQATLDYLGAVWWINCGSFLLSSPH
jgi:hypothetical protein